MVSCGARLAPFDIAELREITMYDELELDTLGAKIFLNEKDKKDKRYQKTALFLIMSDTDSSFNFLISLIYSQLFNLLCEKADDVYGGRLPVHVRCLIDEAANIGQIPNLEKLVATIRSREISACLVLQAQSQLKALYKDNADTISFDYDTMAARKADLSVKEKELSAKITEAQNRIAEINVLKTHIVNYSKTRDVYVAYRKSGYSKKYLEEHEDDIIIHKAAKKAFDEMGVKKLPTVKSLQVEFAEKLTEKKEAYAELKKVRDELRDVAVHTANYEELRDLAERDPRKEKEHGRE